MIQFLIHYGLHFLAPGLIAWIFFRPNWKKAWIIMLATLLVDLDHLLATPLFDPARCSIGHHPLHSGPAIGLYLLLLAASLIPPLRRAVPARLIPLSQMILLGLLFHMLTDYQDCLWM